MIVTEAELRIAGFICGMDDLVSSSWDLEYEQGPLKGHLYILIDKPDGHVVIAKNSLRQDAFKSVRVSLEWPDVPDLDSLVQKLRVWALCLYHELVKPKPLPKLLSKILSGSGSVCPTIYDRLLGEDEL